MCQNHRIPVLLLVALAIAGAACENAPTDPAPGLTAVAPVHSTASAGQPELVSNAIQYRAQDYTHASARSGGASVTARALLGSDGLTELEITTGPLDTADPPPHQLQHIQVKLFSSEDALQYVDNHERIGAGYAAYEYPGRVRHSDIQVQANVRIPNVQGNDRTGVVTVKERVNLRPDLQVVSFAPPAEVMVNTTVELVATVAETNQDVGARANCVLYVEGAEADRADGIWVANGDVVSCIFARAFDTPGEVTLRVAVEEGVPGDWDTSNNAADATIMVLDPAMPLSGLAWVHDLQQHNSYRGYGWSESYWDGGSRAEWDKTEDQSVHLQISRFSAAAEGTLTFPLTLVEFSESSGGATVYEVSLADVAATFTNASQTCYDAWTDVQGQPAVRLAVCSVGSATTSRVGFFSYRVSGHVAYVSTGYHRYRYGSGDWQYYRLSNGVDDQGATVAFGPDYTFEVRVSDGIRTYDAAPVVVLEPFESGYVYPWGCSSWNHSHGQGSLCQERSWQHWGSYGSVVF